MSVVDRQKARAMAAEMLHETSISDKVTSIYALLLALFTYCDTSGFKRERLMRTVLLFNQQSDSKAKVLS